MVVISPKYLPQSNYDQLFKILENRLAPKKHHLVSQHYFLSSYEKHDSSTSDCVTGLRCDIAECEFTVA